MMAFTDSESCAGLHAEGNIAGSADLNRVISQSTANSRSPTYLLGQNTGSVTLNGEEQQLVVMIYFDLRKAFDEVPHKRLLVQLEALGIRPPLLDFIGSYLSNRSQKVLVGCSYSAPQPITSGVFQATVLGPLLFLLRINEISTLLKNSQTFVDADDLKCIYSFPKDTAKSCVDKINTDLRMLSFWSSS
ncbi:unnamed protein product [Schistocephalus solidus]|uniref:Reverse transcriptase domain-containing protein n=1 Tax=Schistocephalus solidus TaxID=70667 RepID=A0A183TK74_SCHSO|nr:unnamed protein product [Schistocephalus solidus]